MEDDDSAGSHRTIPPHPLSERSQLEPPPLASGAADPGLYGSSFADVYDRWYAAPTDTEATVAALCEMADPGANVIELAAGTGRIAIPLAATGRVVWALDSSQPMIDQLTARLETPLESPAALVVHPVLADMAADRWPDPDTGSCTLVFGAWNALWNVTTESAQRQVFRNAHRALQKDGLLVLESAVPDPPGDNAANPVLSLRSVDLTEVVLIATSTNTDEQTITGQHLQFQVDGTVRLRPWRVRWLSPEQTDAFAFESGFELIDHWASWNRDPYTDGSTQRVAVYRRR